MWDGDGRGGEMASQTGFRIQLTGGWLPHHQGLVLNTSVAECAWLFGDNADG
jgi:hypothetical protein